MKQYDTIIWDLDGTLLNTLDDLMDSVNYALKTHGYPERTYKEIRAFIGNGVRRLVELSIPDGIQNPDYEVVFEDFTKYYAKHNMDKTLPYPGVVEAIKSLKMKGYKMAIVSNKIDSAVKKLNNEFFKVDVSIGEHDEIPRKPAPDMVFMAIRKLDANPQKTVYIGDSEVDLKTAANAGLPCISVLWGSRDEKDLLECGATTLASTPESVVEILD